MMLAYYRTGRALAQNKRTDARPAPADSKILGPTFPPFLIILLLLSGCMKQLKITEEIRIKEIEFEGNNSISDKKLKELFLIKKGDPYIERFAREGAKRIVSFYRSKGFFDMRVKKREGEFLKELNEIRMTYHIFEGFRSKIDSIEIEGNTLFSDEKVGKILSINEGDYYDEAVIGTGEYSLSNEYAEKGYTNAEIRVRKTIQNISDPAKRVLLNVEIKEGEKVWVRRIKFKGLKGIRRDVVKREMRINEGDLHRPSRVYESQSRLYRTELFSDVNVQEQKVKEDSVNLSFIFKEEKPRLINFGFGYESPNKGLFLFRWGHLNLFGNLQRLLIDISLRASPEFKHWNDIRLPYREEDIRMTYRESYLLNSGFSLVASPALKRVYTREYSEFDLSLDIVLQRDINLYSRISFLYDFRRATIEEAPSITNRLSTRYFYEGRDNIIVPRKGSRFLSQIEYAGGFLGGDNHFDRVKLDFASYRPLPYRIVLALRAVLILTHSREEPDEISTDVRLEMGGYGTMRGFEEVSIGAPDSRGKRSGLDQLLFNLEFRIPIYRNIRATIFTDIGNLWMDYSDISLKNLKFGVGFGLGYTTPIGVVRLDYARAIEDLGADYRGIVYLNFANPF